MGQPELESVFDPTGDGDLIGAEDADPLSALAASWLREHPRARAGLAVLAAVGTVAALAVAARVGIRAVQGPRPPPLAVTVAESRSEVAFWTPGPQGRPDGAPMLPVLVEARRTRADPDQVSLLDLTGPGLVTSPNASTGMASGLQPTVVFRSPAVNCDSFPAEPHPADYRLRVSVSSGSGTAEHTVPAGAGTGWLDTLQTGCAAWRARRDLTVTSVSAVVDPRLSRTTITLLVTNTGNQPALLGPVQSSTGVTVAPTEPLRIAPLSAGSAAFTLSLDTCDSVTRPVSGTAALTGTPRLTTEIGLAALAGPRLPRDLTGFAQSFDPYSEGLGPTGVVFGRDAAIGLTAALTEACGGIGPMATLLGPGSVSYRQAGGLLTIRLTVDVTPGRVRSLRLATARPEEVPDGFTPLWQDVGPLVPDRTGQVLVTLRYRVSGHSRTCLTTAGFLPTVTATLEVPVGGRVRQVRYTGLIDLAEDPEAIPQLCPSG